MVGSEDSLQNFPKGIFVQEGSKGTSFDHDQFEIKNFLFTLRFVCTNELDRV